jgi:hypothetical protein
MSNMSKDPMANEHNVNMVSKRFAATGALLLAGLAVIGLGPLACAADESPSAITGSAPDSGRDQQTARGDAAPGELSPMLDLSSNSLVFINGSANLGAFRLCFEQGATNSLAPLPRQRTMPFSNEVGVDIGSMSFLDLTPDEVARLSGREVQLYIVRNALLRGRSATCAEVISAAANKQLEEGVDYWKLMAPAGLFQPGPHVAALIGCVGKDAVPSWPECEPEKFKPVAGTLRLVDVSPAVLPPVAQRYAAAFVSLIPQGASNLTLRLQQGEATLLELDTVTQVTNSTAFRALSPDLAATSWSPAQIADYSLQLKTGPDTRLDQTLVRTAELSMPAVLPRDLYKPGPLLFAYVGRITQGDNDPRRAPHLLAIPPRDPLLLTEQPDGGAEPPDAGPPSDAGMLDATGDRDARVR